MASRMLTVESAAGMLAVEPDLVLGLIKSGQLRAFKIGEHLRVREADLEEYIESCALAAPVSQPLEPGPAKPHEADPETSGSSRNGRGCAAPGRSGFRNVPTRTGRGQVQVLGSVADGASTLMGDMRYPLRFSREFFRDLLHHFAGQKVRTGSIFDDVKPGTLGEWVQKKANTRMNPTYAIAALLVDEGYAEWAERGYIRILERRRVPCPADARRSVERPAR